VHVKRYIVPSTPPVIFWYAVGVVAVADPESTADGLASLPLHTVQVTTAEVRVSFTAICERKLNCWTRVSPTVLGVEMTMLIVISPLACEQA
jgi:hypothetical protein